ncbi:MAG: AI-2E family transporter [Elusimicrobiota bacterium]
MKNDSLKKAVLILVILLILLVGGRIFTEIRTGLADFLSVLTPFVLAMIAAYIFDPVTDWLEKHKLSRTFSIVIIVLGLFVLIAGLGAVILPNIIEEISKFISSLPEIADKVIGFLKKKINLPYVQNFLDNIRDNLSAENIKQYIPQATQIIKKVSVTIYSQFLGAVGVIFNILLFLVASFYFLKDFDKIKNYLINLIPRHKKREWVGILKEIDFNLKGFFRGQFIVVTILAVLFIIGLLIVGLDFAFIVGIIAGYLNIIPYFGSTVGIVLSLTLGFVQFGDITHLIYIAAVFGIVQTVDGYFITPKIVGERTGLSPIAVIFSIIVFGWLFGFFGLLIAVPAASVIKVLFKYYIRKYKGSNYYKNKS